MENILTFLRVKKEIRISIMGLDAAGKTSIIQKLQKGHIGSVLPTDGFVVQRFKFKSNFLEICDAGGQDSLRPLWQHYIKCINVLIFVVDCTDSERFDDAKTELHSIASCDPNEDFSLLVMANKQDLPGATSAEHLSLILDLSNLRTRRWHIQASSAKTGEGLKEGFKWAVANKNPKLRNSRFFDGLSV